MKIMSRYAFSTKKKIAPSMEADIDKVGNKNPPRINIELNFDFIRPPCIKDA